MISGLNGIIGVSLKATDLTVHYKSNGIPVRDIVSKLYNLGHTQAHFVPKIKDHDLRDVLNTELAKYLSKFLMTLFIQVPIFILMWVVPYWKSDLLTTPRIFGCKSVYIISLLILSSFNQFVLGASFYRGAYKSVKNCSANMDALVVLGTSAAWFYGLILVIIGYEMP